jgi:hypothetical protein
MGAVDVRSVEQCSKKPLGRFEAFGLIIGASRTVKRVPGSTSRVFKKTCPVLVGYTFDHRAFG